MNLVLALAGGLIGHLLGLPAGWLLGAVATTLIGALSGLRLSFPVWLQTGVVFLVGINVGGALDTGMLPGVGQWLPSLAGLFVSIIATMALVVLFLRGVGKFDLDTAVLASYPGHMVLVLQMAMTSRCDLRQVTMTQSLRMLFLVACLPAIALGLGGDTLPTGPVTVHWPAFAALGVAGLAGVAFARWLRLPAAILLGSVIGSGAASLAGVSMGKLPPAIELAVFVLVGALIGSRFVGTRVRTMLRMLPVALCAVTITVGATFLLAWPVHLMVDIPVAQLLLAYAPGGAEVMTIIALATGYDPAFVGIHHVMRLLVMALMLPVLARWVLTSRR